MLEHIVDRRLLASCIPTPRKDVDEKMPVGLNDPDNFHVKLHADMNGVFSIRHASILSLVERVEKQWLDRYALNKLLSLSERMKKQWRNRGALNKLEDAFWYACYERMQHPCECNLPKTCLRFEVAAESAEKSQRAVNEQMCQEIIDKMERKTDAQVADVGFNLDRFIFAIENYMEVDCGGDREMSSNVVVSKTMQVQSTVEGEDETEEFTDDDLASMLQAALELDAEAEEEEQKQIHKAT